MGTGSVHCQLESILMQALAGYKMEDALISSYRGIAGVADLYRVTTGMHDDLKAMLADPEMQGDSIRKGISEFYFSFMGIKNCSQPTAAAATIIHASNVSKGFNLRVRQSLLAGIGLDSNEIQEAANSAANTGKLPTRKAKLSQLKALTNGDWMNLLNLTVAILSFDGNKEQSFEVKRQDLMSADLSQFSRCSEALAHVLELLQAATTAYGSDFITMYDLFKLIKTKLSPRVQYELDDLIATDKTIDMIRMDWRRIDDLVTDAWNTTSRRPDTYYENLNIAANHPDLTSPNTSAALPTSHAMRPAAAIDTIPEAKTLKCQRFEEDGSMCKDEFVWTVEAQMLHKRLGYTSIPKSCPRHKQPPHIYAASSKCAGKCNDVEQYKDKQLETMQGAEKCRLFQAGKCNYGDRCKFVHVENQLAIAHPSVTEEIDEEDDLIVWQAHIPSDEEDYETATIESDDKYGDIISW